MTELELLRRDLYRLCRYEEGEVGKDYVRDYNVKLWLRISTMGKALIINNIKKMVKANNE